jgi:hypothetical protein
MPNQIKHATHYLFSKIDIRHFKHFLHTFTKTTLNNFCSRDHLIKVFKHQSKSISNTHSTILFTKVSHTKFTLSFHLRIHFKT